MQQVVSPNTKRLMEKVFKMGLNLYKLLGKFKKQKGFSPPDEVINKVCGYYLINSSKILNEYAWFLTTLKKATEEYYAKLSVEEGEKFKSMPVAKELKELIASIGG